MIRFVKVSLVALAVFCSSAFSTRADLEVSADVRIHAVADFEAPLAPHGSWITVGQFGRCWHPAHVAVEWRPYCEGHWEWTDCGWYWVSDEPWGWACYHYGSWTLDPNYGWIWIPGVEWAPAWVEWREGDGYCGWAPLPPRGIVLAPSFFVFVDERRFHEHHHRSALIVNNTTVINRTTVINNIRHETREIAGVGRQRVVVNEGPGTRFVERSTGHRIEARPARELFREHVPREVVRHAEPERRVEPTYRGNERRVEPERRIEPTPRVENPRVEERDRNRITSEPPRTPAARPPEVRTAPVVPRTVPNERSEVRGRENVTPYQPYQYHSPREMERRGSAGRAWRRDDDGRGR